MLFFKNEKSAQRVSVWDGCPADIRGSFARIFECPQMWVWPQVSLGGPSPSTSVPPPTPAQSPIPERCKKSHGGGGRQGGWGLWGALAGGKGPPVALGGDALQTAVGARPTCGGSQDIPAQILNISQGAQNHEQTSVWARTSMTRRRGRPRP